jgi:hypothetical protein
MPYTPIHHTIVAMDVVGSGVRDDQLTLRMRADVRSAVAAVLRQQNLDLAELGQTDLGDGLRLAVPSMISAAVLLDPFVPNLDSYLREHRKASSASARLRLRMVVHQGLVHRDHGEWVGEPMIHCARLLDAPPLRLVMADLPTANLALAVSKSIYDSVVRHGYGLDPQTYEKAAMRLKETDAYAWIHVPGHQPPFYATGHAAAAPAEEQSHPATPGPAADATPVPTESYQNIATGNARVGTQIGRAEGDVHTHIHGY